jgi:hypothetical protein
MFDTWHDPAFGALMLWAWTLWVFEYEAGVIE